jgi:hypothetical protein
VIQTDDAEFAPSATSAPLTSYFYRAFEPLNWRLRLRSATGWKYIERFSQSRGAAKLGDMSSVISTQNSKLKSHQLSFYWLENSAETLTAMSAAEPKRKVNA